MRTLFAFILIFILPSTFAMDLQLTPQKIHTIGKQIWKNETGQNPEYIMSWNKGEKFLSLGIGHFIWFSKNYSGPFKQTFPDFVRFAKKQNANLPAWLASLPSNNTNIPACPWSSREQFYKEINTYKVTSLKKFLTNNFDLQAKFIALRAQDALKQLPAYIPADQKQHVNEQINRMLSTTGGTYAIIDYINFKGLGLKDKPQYGNQRWGLLQVLETMRGYARGKTALRDFANAAKLVLQNRVNHAPNKTQEAKWLPGWYKRIDTYTKIT